MFALIALALLPASAREIYIPDGLEPVSCAVAGFDGQCRSTAFFEGLVASNWELVSVHGCSVPFGSCSQWVTLTERRGDKERVLTLTTDAVRAEALGVRAAPAPTKHRGGYPIAQRDLHIVTPSGGYVDVTYKSYVFEIPGDPATLVADNHFNFGPTNSGRDGWSRDLVGTLCSEDGPGLADYYGITCSGSECTGLAPVETEDGTAWLTLWLDAPYTSGARTCYDGVGELGYFAPVSSGGGDASVSDDCLATVKLLTDGAIDECARTAQESLSVDTSSPISLLAFLADPGGHLALKSQYLSDCAARAEEMADDLRVAFGCGGGSCEGTHTEELFLLQVQMPDGSTQECEATGDFTCTGDGEFGDDTCTCSAPKNTSVDWDSCE